MLHRGNWSVAALELIPLPLTPAPESKQEESKRETASLPGCDLKIEEPMLLPLKLEETLLMMHTEAEISPYLYVKC